MYNQGNKGNKDWHDKGLDNKGLYTKAYNKGR